MKLDKILFGAACIGMGVILHSTYNSGETEPFMKRASYPSVSADSVKLTPALTKDTVCFSEALAKDSVKLCKKLGK